MRTPYRMEHDMPLFVREVAVPAERAAEGRSSLRGADRYGSFASQ